MKKIYILNILIIAIVSILTSPVFAASNGNGSKYFKRNVGIKEKSPQSDLHINGNILIDDSTQALNNILRTDANGLASWVDISNYPSVIGTNNSYNHLQINNGLLQDAYFNGITTISGNLNFPDASNGYILSIMSNGSSEWVPNYGANGASNDALWLENSNTIFPKTNNGEQNLVIGDNNTATAEIVLTKNGGALINTAQISSEDFRVSSNATNFTLQVQTDEDQVGIWLGDPDTRLDVQGHFSIRADGTDYGVTPDANGSVFWLAQNSSYGNNGDVLFRVNSDAQDEVFKLVDFEGTTNGVKTQNGIILTDLSPNSLVMTDANKELISVSEISVGGGGYVGIGPIFPEAMLEIGNASLNFVDGVDDISLLGDLEADGTIYANGFVGDASGLYFNGVDIRHALIYTSTIYESLTFNGGSMINASMAPLYFDANLEFQGNATFLTANTFEIKGAPQANEFTSFYAFNGQIGLNTTSPETAFDINGNILIKDGSQANGYVLTALNSNGLATWTDISATVNYVSNTGNATTANFTDSIVNGTISNSSFIGGFINGATLINVNLTNSNGASEWFDGVDGLYPKDGASKDVHLGATTLGASNIAMLSNGTFRATRFSGDFSGVSNIPYNQEWNDQGSYMHPMDSAGAKTIIIGSNGLASADSIFEANGAVTINEQGINADVRVEGQTEEFLFHTDASSNRVSFAYENPRRHFETNGSVAYLAKTFAVNAGNGLTSSVIQDSRVIFLESTLNCNVNLSSSPQIAAGSDGQIITLIGRYTDEVITLDDNDGLALANNVSFSLRAKDSITLMYSSALGEWIELHRTNYIERAGDSLNRGTCI